MTVTKIRHTGIVVSDMNRSLRFYRDLLGMEVWADFKDDSNNVQAVTDMPGANIYGWSSLKPHFSKLASVGQGKRGAAVQAREDHRLPGSLRKQNGGQGYSSKSSGIGQSMKRPPPTSASDESVSYR